MDTSNILELCVAILTVLSIQFLVIATLAAHYLSRPVTPRPDTEKARTQNASETSPQDPLPGGIPTPYAFPYSTVRDTSSSLYSIPLSLRPPNPVPRNRSSPTDLIRSHSCDSFQISPRNTRAYSSPSHQVRVVVYESSEESLTNHVPYPERYLKDSEERYREDVEAGRRVRGRLIETPAP
jgi:hypothetical protein